MQQKKHSKTSIKKIRKKKKQQLISRHLNLKYLIEHTKHLFNLTQKK